MNGLTTIAALPTAGGCRAELIADGAKANTANARDGIFVNGLDVASGPDQSAVSVMNAGQITHTITLGGVATRQMILNAIRRSQRYGSGML